MLFQHIQIKAYNQGYNISRKLLQNLLKRARKPAKTEPREFGEKIRLWKVSLWLNIIVCFLFIVIEEKDI